MEAFMIKLGSVILGLTYKELSQPTVPKFLQLL